jgi:hypothetical protein
MTDEVQAWALKQHGSTSRCLQRIQDVSNSASFQVLPLKWHSEFKDITQMTLWSTAERPGRTCFPSNGADNCLAKPLERS